VLLSRIQFAFVVSFHVIFLAVAIGDVRRLKGQVNTPREEAKRGSRHPTCPVEANGLRPGALAA
jgi:hypothetical protein